MSLKAPPNSQKCPLSGRPSTILTTSSTLSGEKNQKPPLPSVSALACASPEVPSASAQWARTAKRPASRQRTVALGRQAPTGGGGAVKSGRLRELPDGL